jgi:foldase protein PrsA
MSIFVLGFAAIGCNRGEDAIATVNGVSIPAKDYYEYTMRKPTVRVITQNGAVTANVAGSIGLQSFNDVVNRQLLLQIAQEEGVYPSDGDVAKELQFRVKEKKDFVTQLTELGIPISSIRQDLRIELSRFNIITKGIKVTDDEVQKYIDRNPKQFEEPERAQLRWIFVPNAELKNQAQAELSRGTLFVTVATRYSTAPNARENSAAFPESRVEQLDNVFPGLTKIIRETQPKKATEWIPANAGFAKFFVDKKTDAKKVTPTEVMRERVRRFLMMERGNTAVDLDSRLISRLKEAKVKVNVAELEKAWDKAFKQLETSESKDAASTGIKANKAPETGDGN